LECSPAPNVNASLTQQMDFQFLNASLIMSLKASYSLPSQIHFSLSQSLVAWLEHKGHFFWENFPSSLKQKRFSPT
jgi:hypothetical protein